MLGLPDSVAACLFDLDGVLTDTASLHRESWKSALNPLLLRHGQTGLTDDEYRMYMDGKPRSDGIRDFLRSRAIRLPDGSPGDRPSAATIHGVGNRKNELLLHSLGSEGAVVFEDAHCYLRLAHTAGMASAVVSSSAHTRDVLRVTGLGEWVSGYIDGLAIIDQGLSGKPAADSYLAGARMLGVPPANVAVFEDSLAGVKAGRVGGFGHVVGVNRLGASHGYELAEQGASVVVTSLLQLLPGSCQRLVPPSEMTTGD